MLIYCIDEIVNCVLKVQELSRKLSINVSFAKHDLELILIYGSVCVESVGKLINNDWSSKTQQCDWCTLLF